MPMAMGQLWPPVVDPSTLTRQVWDVPTARAIPGIGRMLQVYGMIATCALDQFRGDELVAPRPRLLELPDVNLRARETFVQVQIEDYLLNGNAVHLVTARGADQWPAGVRWFPAHRWSIEPREYDRGGIRTVEPIYYLDGYEVPRNNVVHVQRGAALAEPWRGVGVVEEFLQTLDRAKLQEAHETETLRNGGVPSVAIIAPQTDITETEIDEAKEDWRAKYAGPGREPGLFPAGSQVIPLGWSPADSELTEARKMTLTDLANLSNLDPYWLGGQSSSYTYKSPGPMFLALLRMSLNPVMRTFEQVWSLAWLPYGRSVRFDRLELTRDDWTTEVATGAAGVAAGLITAEEWRVRQGLPVEPEFGELRAPAPPAQLEGPPTLTVVPGDSDTDSDAGDADQERA